MRDYIESSVIAVLACLFCIWLFKPLAIRIGLVDRPSSRKLHAHEPPLIGGIAIFFGFCFALLHLHVSLQPYRSLLAGSSVLILMGIVDDFHDLSARFRLLGQVMVALMLTSWGGLVLQNLGDILFLGDIKLLLWGLPFTLLLVVTNLNAMNMIDGQDGLAGSIALGQTLWLLVFSHILHLQSLELLLIILAMLLVVFLCFNMCFPWRKQASIFLGDSGSTFLAFLLIWAAIQLANQGVIKPIEILWVLALPLFDMGNVIIYRIRCGFSIFRAGRDHGHHVLERLGFSKMTSTNVLFLISGMLGGVGYGLYQFQISEGISFVAFVASFGVYLLVLEFMRFFTKESHTEMTFSVDVEQHVP
ncbi:MAG: undecaprenyl-phosphate alpha-N-acetylglucosaminyl 1-phosphate transferase [Coxiella sp. RIFCSPHIGHO2_12_FULL_42_15]|nr:MAG: undecaprenyl-phosphate alpha-N-acetylglucosaminyl 1-phosphate transferase [Coxiella sp. RIFCSPHIGHO2_12_FULL_42_15]